jgi:ankyrin repeat protein
MKASRMGDVGITELLLKHDAAITLLDKRGLFALMHASRYGRNEVVKLLIKILIYKIVTGHLF